MSSSEPNATEPNGTMHCAECDARLAHDQRYCVECGARRGPLRADVAQMIGAIHEQGPAATLPADAPLADSLAGMDERPPRAEFRMPGPRAAAVAVMCMLGFGVIVGSLAGGTNIATLAAAPLIVVRLAQPASSTPPSQVVTPGDNSGGEVAAAPTTPAATATQTVAQTPPSAGVSALPTSGTGTTPVGSTTGLPPVKHVFLIVLSDRGFFRSFASHGGYLSGPLRRQGELVQNYYAVAGAPLANEIALTSGQGPTAETASDCPKFTRIQPAHKGPHGQVLGNGCVYPGATKSLASQLSAARDSWKAYVGGVSSSAQTACRVPKLGSKQPQTANAHTEYLAWRNPFLYYHTLTAGTACHQNEVGIGRLATDLKSEQTTPSFAYIIPPVCASGSEASCKPGANPGLAAANRFLKTVVPEIKRSAAYKNGGLIAVTFDQAPQTGAHADPSACCNSPATYPNLRRLAPGQPAVPPGAMGEGTTTTSTTSTTPTDTTGTDTTATTPTDTTGTTPTGTTGTTTTSTTPTDTTGTTTTGTTPTDTTPTDTTGTTTTGTTTSPANLGVGETTPTGGGGQVGLLLISPYVKANSSDVVDYFNHFSLLASIENLFGLHRLGYAGAIALPTFGAAVFSNYNG
jgi:phosphatidylinositol-3-phosphatase